MSESKNGNIYTTSEGITAQSEAIREAAEKINSIDAKIQTDLESINSIFAGMNSCWTGAASNFVLSAFQKHMGMVMPARQEVMQGVVKYLRDTVAANYEESENWNVSLADAFL